MTLVANPPAPDRSPRLLSELAGVLRAHLPRPRPRRPAPERPPDSRDALLRALCHDMRSPLASLEAALGSLGRGAADSGELLDVARLQAAQLSSMLRTAEATGGAQRRGTGVRRLVDVVRAAIAASGLPAGQLTVELGDCAGEVAVADARVQRILTNLLENAHRHGGGAPVRLSVTCRAGSVDLALTQPGVHSDRLHGYLRAAAPPPDLTGLGLWSVQRQTRELGGRVRCTDGGEGMTLTVQLPDR